MQERIIELLTRKLAGEATRLELEELEYLVTKYPDSVYYEELLKELWIPSGHETDIENQYNKHLSRYGSELEFLGGEHKTSSYRHRFRSPAYVLCSLIVLSVAGFLFFFRPKTHKTIALKPKRVTASPVRPRPDSLNTHITAEKGVRKKITLPDGTQVWLNADSRLSYDLDKSFKEHRSVTLSGEASFDVTHDKAHPFIVYTDKIAVKVLGTAFNIKAYPGDKESTTTLLRGSIELSLKSRPQQKILLSPSETFTLIENKKIIPDKKQVVQSLKDITLVLSNIDSVKIGNKKYIEETSWTKNELVFQNETFEELIPKLERWFNVRIRLNKARLRSQHFTGVFTNENIEQALMAMQLIKQFNFKIKDYDVIIY